MKKNRQSALPEYILEKDGTFVIRNYNFSKPFANFFPAIAGEYGIPLWAFYVNRGQCISSFGIKDKDHAILEFFPANKSWQLTANSGFRSFLKIDSSAGSVFYEPFHNGLLSADFAIENTMQIRPHELTLREENRSLGLTCEVNYFPVPNESFAALARVVKIKNTSRKKQKIQFLDGLPALVPYGVNNRILKKLGRTAEAWMRARVITNAAAVYKLEVDLTDRPEVTFIKPGNFYVSFSHPIIDADDVFGPRLNFDYPYRFIKEKEFSYPRRKSCESKTPCAMAATRFELLPNEEKTLRSLFGNAQRLEILRENLKRIKNNGFFTDKKCQNQQIIQKLQNDISTQSAAAEFNHYCGSTYLDNIIRGGYPVIFNSRGKQKQVFYLYMRKHGDLERDYNKFQIQPSYFSQGNGNFRDIVQNRRSDIWFDPRIEDSNLITFLNLIQTDGYNPLIVKGLQFHLKDKAAFEQNCAALVNKKDLGKLIAFLDKPYTPGCVISFIEESNLCLKVSRDEFLDYLMVSSDKEEDAEHKQADDHGAGGFWTDHWSYCLDLLETFLELYPEKSAGALFAKKEFKFYNNVFVVRPRKEKYTLYEGKFRQLDALRFDPEKADMQSQWPTLVHWVRTDYGRGGIYQTTLISKLLCILVNKLASLDPAGCGIEMEANKPNWYDALNGLPALLGSSICETMELKRLALFLKDSLEIHSDIRKISLFEDLHNFLLQLNGLLENSDTEFEFWDKSQEIKEAYRDKTRLGISAAELTLDNNFLREFLKRAIIKLEQGIKKAFLEKEGLYCAYFINEASDYQIKEGVLYARKFIQKRLPLFLEAQVHALKIEKDKSLQHKLYAAVKKSELYDTRLKMYKVTGNLTSAPLEIGRCRAFSRGWLENESVWLHMEYKYLLELLEAGLYEEFYSDFKNVLVCFHDPARYGRSILENSSFIVSSAFSDKSLIGNGFVARLSGATAEFLHIWRIMNVGKKPFFINAASELNLKFSPILAGWLFKKDGSYGFNFLGSIRVSYSNPARKNTFGKNPALIKKISFKDKAGKNLEIASDIIPAPYAEQIRLRLIPEIKITLT